MARIPGNGTLSDQNRSMESLTVRPELEVGKPDDPYEKEADTVADQVMSTPETVSGIRMKPASSLPDIRMKCEKQESIQMQPEDEEMLQARSIHSSHGVAPVQRQPVEEEEEMLQPKMNEDRKGNTSDISTTLTRSKGSGTALPPPTRDFMEQGIGADFSKVRIHTGSQAIQMNRKLNAKAFTHGNNIYFNEGEYNPDTSGGQYLLAHELTHVVQQGGGSDTVKMKPDVQKNGDGTKRIFLQGNNNPPKVSAAQLAATRKAIATQRKMWMDLRSMSNAGRKLAGSGYDPNIRYVRVDFTEGKRGNTSRSGPILYVGPAFANEKDASKRKEKLEEVLKKVDEFRIKKGRIDNHDVTDNHVNQLLDKLNSKELQDLVIKLKVNQKYIANQAMVTHIQNKIKLLAKIAAAKQDIVKTFKVKSVVDGDQKWKLDELMMLKDAFSKLPKSDRSVLIGVEIKRVISLGGTTAGQFSHKVDEVSEEDTKVTHSKVMELADLAFSSTKAKAIETIIHEVGHGVANKKLHEANIAYNEAIIASNKQAAKTTDSHNRLTAANAILDPAVKALNDKIKEARKEKDPAKRALLIKQIAPLRADYNKKKAISDKLLKENKADLKASKAAEKVMNSRKAKVEVLKISASQLKAIKKANNRAKATHDARLKAAKTAAGKIKITHTDVQSYLDAVMEVSKKLDDFHKDTLAQDKTVEAVEALIKDVDRSIADRDTARKKLVSGKKGASMIAALASLETAQAALFEAAKKHSLAKNRNKKVHEFAKFVEKKKIKPISPYATDNWPHKPEEFYAEAYAFWVTGKLQTISPVLNRWFDRKKYK